MPASMAFTGSPTGGSCIWTGGHDEESCFRPSRTGVRAEHAPSIPQSRPAKVATLSYMYTLAHIHKHIPGDAHPQAPVVYAGAPSGSGGWITA